MQGTKEKGLILRVRLQHKIYSVHQTDKIHNLRLIVGIPIHHGFAQCCQARLTRLQESKALRMQRKIP